MPDSKMFTLALTDPVGNVVWSREIEPKYVATVGQFLQDHMGLLIAAKGMAEAARGFDTMLQGLSQVGGTKPRLPRKR